jgi:hypothetical protein
MTAPKPFEKGEALIFRRKITKRVWCNDKKGPRETIGYREDSVEFVRCSGRMAEVCVRTPIGVQSIKVRMKDLRRKHE